MEFEYDPAKSLSNKDKHGIDFVEARSLWDDERRIEAPARSVGEARFVTIGKIGARIWTAVWTPRGGIVRLISVRRARDGEVKAYGSQQDDHR